VILIRRAALPVLLGLLGAALSCTTHALKEPCPEPHTDETGTFQQTLSRNLDILFMVDDSGSMRALQDKLATSFPAFMNVLEALPLPNVHIAVISSDLGAGKLTSGVVPGCATGGDQGRFQFAPHGDCSAAGLNPGQTFIANINGMANYTGDLPDVFKCIAALGESGCNFEHVFGSVLRSLGADGHGGAPPENIGFLRPDAYLAVIFITNEDDCSAPPDSDVFDPTSRYVSDPLGPLTSYRCNHVGHRCDGQAPPLLSGGALGNCVSAEDGVLLKVADVVAALKGLKTDPSKILVSAIAGPPTPYVVTLSAQPNNDDPAGVWPEVMHSCTAPDGTFADPAVRIFDLVHAFGGNGVFQPICDGSLTPALQQIAQGIATRLGSQCVEGIVLDTNGAPWTGADVPGPDCTVTNHGYNANGDLIDVVAPSCATSDASECWRLEPGTPANGCPGQHVLSFPNRGQRPSHIDTSIACSVSTGSSGKTPGCSR
jgi:hypothetical protein